MNPCHQRGVLRYWLWHGNLLLFKHCRCISQIQLIKHAVAPVLRQCAPVVFSECFTLGKQSFQVSPLCQFITVQRLVNLVVAHLVVLVAHRYYIDTLAGLQTDLPVILWHTRYHMVVGQLPTWPHVAVLNPNIAVLLGKPHLRYGILHKDTRMGLTVQVYDLALVDHQIL